MTSASAATRVCFELQVDPSRPDEHLARHPPVWPQMLREIAASHIAAKWEAEMAGFFVGLEGRPDQAATALTEVFNLHDQLTAAAAGTPAESTRP